MKKSTITAAALLPMLAAGMLAAPANAGSIRVRTLPPRYVTAEMCIDFQPTTRANAALTNITVTARGVAIPAFFCPGGRSARIMHRSWVTFRVRYTFTSYDDYGKYYGRYTTRVRMVNY